MCKINCSGGCFVGSPEDHQYVWVVMIMDYGGEFKIRSIRESEEDAIRELRISKEPGHVTGFPLGVPDSIRFQK